MDTQQQYIECMGGSRGEGGGALVELSEGGNRKAAK